MEDAQHYHGSSPLGGLSLGIVTQFPLDYNALGVSWSYEEASLVMDASSQGCTYFNSGSENLSICYRYIVNDDGETIVETAMVSDLAIANTFFEKKVNQFVYVYVYTVL